MPQQILPIFIEGRSSINEAVHYEYDTKANTVSYFLFCLPFYTHSVDDKSCFKLAIAQLIVMGHCKKCEIIKKLQVSKSFVDRAVTLYSKEGVGGFFKARNFRGSPVLTDEVIAKAQQLLASGDDRCEVAKTLGIKLNTLAKAIAAGRLIEKKESR